jgi:hypothetical protein
MDTTKSGSGVLFLVTVTVSALMVLVGWGLGGFLGEDKKRRQKYERTYDMWYRMWICNTCGHVWTPSGVAS